MCLRVPACFLQNMTMEQAETLALQTLKQVMEEKLSATNVEVATVTMEGGYHIFTAEEIGAVTATLDAE